MYKMLFLMTPDFKMWNLKKFSFHYVLYRIDYFMPCVRSDSQELFCWGSDPRKKIWVEFEFAWWDPVVESWIVFSGSASLFPSEHMLVIVELGCIMMPIDFNCVSYYSGTLIPLNISYVLYLTVISKKSWSLKHARTC